MYSLYWIAILISRLSFVYGIRLVTFGKWNFHARTTNALSSEITTTTPKSLPDLNCDFDVDTCNWKNARGLFARDDFNWNHGFGDISHKRKTGAKDDHGGGGGYMYIRSGSNTNRTAKLYSNAITSLRKAACLKFWYHMRGRHMGHLKVYLPEFKMENLKLTMLKPIHGENPNPMWQVYGSQGNKWQEGKIPIQPFHTTHYVIFEAFDWDAGRMGNILLDDITFPNFDDEDDCTLSPIEASPPPVSTTSSITTQKTKYTAKVTMEYNQLASTQQSWNVSHITKPTTHKTTATMTISTSSKALTKHISVSSRSVLTKSSLIAETSSSSERHRQTTSETKITVYKDSTTHKVWNSSYKIYTAAGIVGVFIVFAASLLCFVRYKRQRRLSYYDNCTVAMTRMAPDGAKSSNQSLEYRMLA